MNIRQAKKSDLPDITLILNDTNLFPAEMLEEMISPFLLEPDGPEKWLVCEDDSGQVVGFCYYRPEPFAEGTWNLLAIGLRTEKQNRGYGSLLISAVELSLSTERVLIVETSGLEDFDATRKFYDKCGYDREATIRDYWADGDDKVIFRKSLS